MLSFIRLRLLISLVVLSGIVMLLMAGKPTVQRAEGIGRPAVAPATAGLPVGLYYMQVFLPISGYVKKTAWYFAPDGTVYGDVTGGLGPADLARVTSWKGRARIVGNQMEVRWTDGSVYTAEMVYKEGGFKWASADTGFFLPVKPYKSPKELVGSYQVGFSHAGNEGDIHRARTFTLRPDGTYTCVVNDATKTQTGGTWRLTDSYSMLLTNRTGKSISQLVFPVEGNKDSDGTGGIYVDGKFCRRL